MTPLELVNLIPLMARTHGRADITIALIDGPVALTHPEFTHRNIREIPGTQPGACARAASAACLHGTFVAGMLMARASADASGICPDCTLLVRPIFPEERATGDAAPSSTGEGLAAAIVDSVTAGARVINLSAALSAPSSAGQLAVRGALDLAARHEVICVVAAGNEGVVGSSELTRHPWVIPVSACDRLGWPLGGTNLGRSIGQNGLRAPGEGVTGLGPHGVRTLGGTSVAAPFVTGTVALLLSAFPRTAASRVKLAVTRIGASPRRSVVPPLLDAWAAYETLAA